MQNRHINTITYLTLANWVTRNTKPVIVFASKQVIRWQQFPVYYYTPTVIKLCDNHFGIHCWTQDVAHVLTYLSLSSISIRLIDLYAIKERLLKFQKIVQQVSISCFLTPLGI